MMKPPSRPTLPAYEEMTRQHLDALLQIRDMGDDLARAFAARPGREAALNALRMLRIGSDIGPRSTPHADFKAELVADLCQDEFSDEEDLGIDDLSDRSTDDMIAELVEELGLDPETIYGARNRRHAAEMAAILARLAAPDEAPPQPPLAIAAPAIPRPRENDAPPPATILAFKHQERK